MSKAIECHYAAKAPKVSRPRTQHVDDASIGRQEARPGLETSSPIIENRQEAGDGGDVNLETTAGVSDLEFANLEGESFDWNYSNIDFGDLFNPQTNDRTVEIQQAISASNQLIPTISTYTRRSLFLRPNIRTGAQRVANLILYTLKSYPLMMLNHKNLPPFIHPSFITPHDENKQMEPLTNCISLLHMISNGAQASRRLFWKMVQLECERLRVTVR
jgi:hypothetical protein